MRILHVGKFWPPYAGGIERAMRDLCLALSRRNVEASVLAHATPPSWRSVRYQDEGLPVSLAACPGQLAYAPISAAFPVLLGRMIARHKPEALHLHMPNPAAFWALMLPAARRLPWIVHWHSDIPLADAPGAVRAIYPAYRWFETALLRRAACVIATSPDYRDSSVALRPWLDKVRVIPLGIEAAGSTPEPAREVALRLWPGDGLRVLAVGRLSHYKGYDVLLDALADAPGVQLLLIGDGECMSALRAQVDRLGLASRVNLAGRLDDGQRDAAYAAAELFCLPSVARSEAFGVVLLEAMRSHLPVVASRVPGSGMAWVLDHGGAGRLVAPADAAALATALSDLARDSATRQQLAEAGHRRWQKHFTLDASADQVAALYREVLDSPVPLATTPSGKP